jgi:uncharacterized RDD family membrane protein YckC
MFEGEETSSFPTNAKSYKRIIAKAVDLTIAIVPIFFNYYFGILWGLLYISLADSLGAGESPGKRIFHLHVIDPIRKSACTRKQSCLRNLNFTVCFLLMIIPLPGSLIIGMILALVSIALEIQFIWREPHGLRLGDVIAETEVVRYEIFVATVSSIKKDPHPDPLL